MKQSFRLLFTALLIVVATGTPANAQSLFDDLKIFTEDDPPYNFLDEGQPAGASVDTLLAIFAELNIKYRKQNIVFSSWARGYNETLQRKNTMLFSTKRVPSRENLFKWIGPLSTARLVLISRRDREIYFKSGTIPKTFKYGVSKNDYSEIALLSAGVKQGNLVNINSHNSAIQMLNRGRIDAWARDYLVAQWVIRQQGYDMQDYKVAHVFSENQHYFAFNKNTNPAIIAQMQKAFETIKSNGIFTSINQKYFGTLLAKAPEELGIQSTRGGLPRNANN